MQICIPIANLHKLDSNNNEVDLVIDLSITFHPPLSETVE